MKPTRMQHSEVKGGYAITFTRLLKESKKPHTEKKKKTQQWANGRLEKWLPQESYDLQTETKLF